MSEDGPGITRHARAGLLLATLLGLGFAAWMIGAVGARQIIAAMASIGWVGMAVLVGWSGGVLLLLGLAWHAVAPGEPPAHIPRFVWARTTREAATDVLPFSQLGGLVIGARTLAIRGMRPPLIYASMIADMTTEMAAQLLFTLGGIAALLLVLSDMPVRTGLLPVALAGLAAMVVILLLLAFAQRPMLRLAAALGARLLPRTETGFAAIRAELDAIYRLPARVAAAFILNLLAWVASAAGAWIALRFMGLAPPLWAVIALEALIFTLRSVAFMVPGALGVQEATYAVLGPLFGIPPTAALALSLLKRARDLIIGVPALAIWQAQEVAALRLKPARAG